MVNTTKLETMEDSSTVRLNNKLKKKLVKLGARMSLKDGESRRIEEIIEEILKYYEDREGKIE